MSKKSENQLPKFGPEAFLRRAAAEVKKRPPQKTGKSSVAIAAELESDALARVRVELDPRALSDNYRAILDLVGGERQGLFLLPMVKGDGYGHGLEWVVKHLHRAPHLAGFGVATLEEGLRVRKVLGPRGSSLRVQVFSQTGPWNEAKAQFFAEHGLTATLSQESDLRLFLKRGDAANIQYEIFFNTGMNRLGIPISLLREVGKLIGELPAEQKPTGVATHLGNAENFGSKMSQLQFAGWREVVSQLRDRLPAAFFHCGNSAAIWNSKHWKLEEFTQIVRPGLALYGATPTADLPARGIRSVMRVRAPVIQTHRLSPGESMGYGAAYTAPNDQAVHVAVLDIGYADGLMRSLGGRGVAYWSQEQKTLPILGRVSMDLCAVQCSPHTQPGEWVELWGDGVGLWKQAQAAGTIPYECMTQWSNRVPRVEHVHE